MNSIRRLLSLWVVMVYTGFFCPPLKAHAQQGAMDQRPEVTIAGSQVLELASKITGQRYDIYVLLPDGYTKSKAKYPVFYTMDGHSDFALMAAMVGGLAFDVFAPTAIVVSITSGEEDQDLSAWRFSHYMPAEGAQVGPAQFLALIRDELIPLIEAEYRADPNDRLLLGSSLAGFFALYALFHQPDLFQRYISSSPSLWWDDEVALSYEEQYAKANTDLKAQVALSVGQLEEVDRMVEPLQRLAAKLAERAYPGLKLHTDILTNQNHGSVKPAAYTVGLKKLYFKEERVLPAQVLKAYVGTYQAVLNDGSQFSMEITQEGERLFYQSMYDDRPKRFYATSSINFFSRVRLMEVRFNLDETGVCRSLTFLEAEGDWDLQRVE